MTEKINKINNPLTIIAIFAALAEVNATVAIGLIDKDLHSIFIWFVIGFPTLLVILFFITLNYNTKVMYSPSDYKDDKSFMDSIFGNYYGNKKDNKDDLGIGKISTELEAKITEKLISKINDSIKDSNDPKIQKEINQLKDQIKKITDQSIIEVKGIFALPPDLKGIMLNFYRFPAFYMIIYAAIMSKAKSVDGLKSSKNKYYLPGEWETAGLQELFEKGIFIGTDKNFQINPQYQEHLEYWREQNNNKLKVINDAFRIEDNSDDEDVKIKYNARIKEITNRLKF
ncbi:MAG: hypothetical protein HQ510_00110 [Candidatus Marinimicrobia bacterium]|nr:hypothetical protein [Candidatus Neomarinimicrobiota bacterium]